MVICIKRRVTGCSMAPARSRAALRCTCMLPPPQLTGTAAANPRSIFSPLAMAYLGDAVWEAHTRALELELDMLQQEQQVRPDESLSARGNAAGPGQLPRPADSPFGGTGGEARDSSEAQQLQPPEVGNRTVDAGAPCQGRSAAISHLVSLTRQQRKLWASAAFQAQVFDALMGAGLPLKPPPPPSAPPAASISDLQLPSPYPTAEAPGTSAATGSGAGHPASASLPVPAEAPAAAGTAAGAAAHASVAASSQLLSLTAAESDVLRWGRNAAVGSIPKSVSAGTYKKATAVEVLVAHLYLTAPERCAQLIQAAVSLAPLPP